MKRLFVFVFACLLLSGVAVAQPQPDRIILQFDGTNYTGLPQQSVIVGPAELIVSIDCTPAGTCIGVKPLLDNSAQKLSVNDSTTTQATIHITSSVVNQSGSTLVLLPGDHRIFLRRAAGGAATGTAGGAASGTGCGPLEDAVTYEPDANRAHFYVTVDGSILKKPDHVDENDSVVVHVRAIRPEDEALLGTVKVARISATRVPATRIVGSDATITNFKAAGGVCERTFTLGDFNPDEGAVEITRTEGGAEKKDTFKFTVDKLYAGTLSFGPIFTRGVGNPTFKLAPKGDKKVIVASEEGSKNVVYAVDYTYYMWGQRDLEKGDPRWFAHINPTIGVSITNMSDHAIFGATIDVGQFLFTIGSHLEHVNRLAASSGLSAGSEFAGEEAAIPQSKRWLTHGFVGVSVDLRAAAALLKALGTGGGS